MVETIATSPITLAIAGGLVHGSIYGGKAYIDGETFEPIKYILTLILAGVIGVAFYLVGFDPTPADWGLVLLAYTGLVAEAEAILKLLIRGQTKEAQNRLDYAREEAQSGTQEIRDSDTGRELSERMRETAGVPPVTHNDDGGSDSNDTDESTNDGDDSNEDNSSDDGSESDIDFDPDDDEYYPSPEAEDADVKKKTGGDVDVDSDRSRAKMPHQPDDVYADAPDPSETDTDSEMESKDQVVSEGG